MDGYAVVFNEHITEWTVRGSISAGNYRHYKPVHGDAIEIMTGAKIPEGFDTVIPVEDITSEKEHILLKPGVFYKAGLNIRKAGEDIKAGDVIIKRNTLVTPKEIAALASAGKWEIDVFRKLKIGILTTGDETC